MNICRGGLIALEVHEYSPVSAVQIRLISDGLIGEDPATCNCGLCIIKDDTNLNTKVFCARLGLCGKRRF